MSEHVNRYGWFGRPYDDEVKKQAAFLAYEAASDPDWGAGLIAAALIEERRKERARWVMPNVIEADEEELTLIDLDEP